jgi:predicted RNase H-like HicB family nuclease
MYFRFGSLPGMTTAKQFATISGMKTLTIEIIPDPHGGFTARLPDVPAYGEGNTEEEAMADLKEGLHAYIDAFGLNDALARVSSPISIRQLRMSLRDFSLA